MIWRLIIMQTFYIPVSIAELIDKITILEIKLERINNAQKIQHVTYEHNLLTKVMLDYNIDVKEFPVDQYFADLKLANEKIWDAENLLRIADDSKLYDEHFVQAAREAFTNNMKRHQIKQKINVYFQSNILEEKQYG